MHVVCGILVPRPGIEPVTPAMEAILTTGLPGNSLQLIFLCVSSRVLLRTITCPKHMLVLEMRAGWGLVRGSLGVYLLEVLRAPGSKPSLRKETISSTDLIQ